MRNKPVKYFTFDEASKANVAHISNQHNQFDGEIEAVNASVKAYIRSKTQSN